MGGWEAMTPVVVEGEPCGLEVGGAGGCEVCKGSPQLGCWEGDQGLQRAEGAEMGRKLRLQIGACQLMAGSHCCRAEAWHLDLWVPRASRPSMLSSLSDQQV